MIKTKITKQANRADPRKAPFRVKSILVPLDFSTASKKGLDEAIAVTRQFKATLTLRHVVEPVATPDFVGAFPF